MRQTPTCGLVLGATLALGVSACGGTEDKKGSDAGSPSKDGGGPSHGWKAAVGDQGLLLQTFDDAVWEARTLAVPEPVSADLFSVTCVSNRVGWVSGADGVLLHTVDSGETWRPQVTSTSADLLALHFGYAYPEYVGVAAGTQGTLLVSWSSGDSWSAWPLRMSGALRAVAMSYEQELIVVGGDHGALLRSTDQGRSFVSVSVASVSAASASAGSDPDFTGIGMDDDAARVVAVDAQGRVWASTDRARSFALAFDGNVPLAAVSVAHDGSWALAAGDESVVLRFAAETWEQVEPSADMDEPLQATLISRDSAVGYVAGGHGALFRSSDQGVTFSRMETGTALGLNGLEDLDPY